MSIFTLSASQQTLFEALVRARKALSDKCTETVQLGTITHPKRQFSEMAEPIPERIYEVRFTPNYGVVAPGICVSNGSAYWIAACCPEGSLFTQSP